MATATAAASAEAVVTPYGPERVRPLHDAAAITARIEELGVRIGRDYAAQEIVLCAVLKGSFVFVADLCRAIPLRVAVEFIGISSYGSRTETSGVVKITQDLSVPVEGRHVLVVEDIVDTGLTMQYLRENLMTRHPASLKICTLLHKPARARAEVPLDYVGFVIPDEFVVGYGLDYDQRYRNLPYIGVLQP
ncbi:MAG TPA: hypoxanthine phosphoribosyltransferase [Myxococcota bacterium]|jgi:hypoxanthine phosphoribosyltransferase|nr:hypoxanthine phosphoribosyltransferase [Myxococcota bacterium]